MKDSYLVRTAFRLHLSTTPLLLRQKACVVSESPFKTIFIEVIFLVSSAF